MGDLAERHGLTESRYRDGPLGHCSARWDREGVLAAMHRFVDRYGYVPRMADMRGGHGLPGPQTASRYLPTGTYGRARRWFARQFDVPLVPPDGQYPPIPDAGRPPSSLTEDAVLARIRRYAEEHGYIPTHDDMRADDSLAGPGPTRRVLDEPEIGRLRARLSRDLGIPLRPTT